MDRDPVDAGPPPPQLGAQLGHLLGGHLLVRLVLQPHHHLAREVVPRRAYEDGRGARVGVRNRAKIFIAAAKLFRHGMGTDLDILPTSSVA